MMRLKSLTFRAWSTAAAAVLMAVALGAQTIGEPERFTASAIDVNTGRTGQIEISIDRWSTTRDRASLAEILFSRGTDKLIEAVRDMRPVGRIRSTGSIGYELRFAEQRQLPEGDREIILATDRPMSFWELSNRPRSADYPFTWVQLRVKRDGTGQGSLAVAARITGDPDDRTIEVEDYALQPVRLENVRSAKHHN